MKTAMSHDFILRDRLRGFSKNGNETTIKGKLVVGGKFEYTREIPADVSSVDGIRIEAPVSIKMVFDEETMTFIPGEDYVFHKNGICLLTFVASENTSLSSSVTINGVAVTEKEVILAANDSFTVRVPLPADKMESGEFKLEGLDEKLIIEKAYLIFF